VYFRGQDESIDPVPEDNKNDEAGNNDKSTNADKQEPQQSVAFIESRFNELFEDPELSRYVDAHPVDDNLNREVAMQVFLLHRLSPLPLSTHIHLLPSRPWHRHHFHLTGRLIPGAVLQSAETKASSSTLALRLL
jgi:hypothetical protein